MGPEEATTFKSAVARANYLAQDRPDIIYTTKEICRKMAAPTVGSWRKLLRFARYLIHCPRRVGKYAWQGGEEEV